MSPIQRRDQARNKIATFGHEGQAEAARCGFIVSGEDEAPRRPRFCDAPALPGSAYCALHHARCAIRPDSAAGARLIRRLRREAARTADPPQEMAFLASVAVAELDSADEPADIAACIDITPNRDATPD